MLLTNTQISKICKSFANGSTANIKLSKPQLSKMVQLGEFLPLLLMNSLLYLARTAEKMEKTFNKNKCIIVAAINVALQTRRNKTYLVPVYNLYQ